MKTRLRYVAVPSAVVALILAVMPAAAEGAAPHTDFAAAPSAGRLSATLTPKALDAAATVDVMVQLTGDPVAVVQAKSAKVLKRAQKNQIKAGLRKAQRAVRAGITAKGGRILSQLQSAYNGMRVRVPASRIAALAALPGVAGVHALTPKSVDNTTSVPYLSTADAWQYSGVTGAGVKVAIIDTGIDYTHADFGGPGTVEAYQSAKSTSARPVPATSALFGVNAPRIKGGYDFVGDDYDAGVEGSTPHPDANPLDCEGHGTHVAGTAAGGGVASDGTAYTGPYDRTTSSKTFKVGPGVAPKADLYALRVFGCTGSTDVAVEAIDWAVDHGMDVINMSLGGPFGSPDDPDAVAASNAVAAGVVVVASAGNSGHSPYITGSPASGQGVISVAAMDTASNLQSASLQFGDGSTVDAINANGASLPAGSFRVVALTDDPTTAENEALGCSPGAYSSALPAGDLLTIAVVSRGTCARVAKAIYGQQAGADAVLMINSDDQYPPYEGAVTSNPDTGEPFTLTIPFLGVPHSDGPALVRAAGQSITMLSGSIDNPGFRQLAGFSSVGPANGDSGVSPNVTAPGVSISSAAVGSGTAATVMSGTSMAAPHVAGVAALAVQAHPRWSADQVASAVVGTADPAGVAGYSVTGAGAGLVDPVQAVKTRTVVTGDQYRTKSGRVSEASLSFGVVESSSNYRATKVITIANTATRAATYQVSAEPSAQSGSATVAVWPKKVVVPARSSRKVAVSLTVPTGVGGSSLGDDPAMFAEVSGTVVVNSGSETQRVPYLLVPRAQARVAASLTRQRSAAADQRAAASAANAQWSLNLTNAGGAISAYADVYTLGLTDRADLPKTAVGSGYDLRALGVQSFDTDSGTLMVFAINNHDRFTNAAANEFDVLIDTNGDGAEDYIVFAADSGAYRSGNFDGVSEVFIYQVAGNALYASGYLAMAPTNSSTVLLPVQAADLGLSADSGAFSYTGASYTALGVGSDAFTGWASYDPWRRAIADGGGATVARNSRTTVPITVDSAAWAKQRPQGVMVAVFDNHSGAAEALLLSLR
mgnify:CR=1 FL=1